MAIKSDILIVRWSQMELEKDGVREKSFLGALVFGHSYCSSINSTEFNVEHKKTCPFPCHTGRPIDNISGHLLTCNCANKNCFIIFCIKFTIYKKMHIFQKYSFKNLSSIFFFTIPEQSNYMEKFQPKKKSCNIFPSRNFC